TVEAYLRDLLAGQASPIPRDSVVAEPEPSYIVAQAPKVMGGRNVVRSKLQRQSHEVFVETYLRDSLIHLNPEIKEQPGRAEEVIYKLRAIVLSVRSD